MKIPKSLLTVPAPPSEWSGLAPYSRWTSCCTWTLGLQHAPDVQRLLGRNQSCLQLPPEKNTTIKTCSHVDFVQNDLTVGGNFGNFGNGFRIVPTFHQSSLESSANKILSPALEQPGKQNSLVSLCLWWVVVKPVAQKYALCTFYQLRNPQNLHISFFHPPNITSTAYSFVVLAIW